MALIDDIRLELGASPVSDDLLNLWIEDAYRQIERRAKLLGVTVDPKDRDYVARLAVVAHARRPNGDKQVMISVDDGQVSRTYDSSAGRVVVWDDLLAEIGLAPQVDTEWSGSIAYPPLPRPCFDAELGAWR